MNFKPFSNSKLYFHKKTMCRKQRHLFWFILYRGLWQQNGRSVKKRQTKKQCLREQTKQFLWTRLKTMIKL